jgi:hypothetical protein
MENRRILSWRNWSTVRKAQVVGAVVGVFLPLGITSLGVVTGPHEIFDLFSILEEIIFTPPTLVMQALGLNTITYTGEDGILWATFTLMVFINSLLYLVAGSLIGLLLNLRRNSRQ